MRPSDRALLEEAARAEGIAVAEGGPSRVRWLADLADALWDWLRGSGLDPREWSALPWLVGGILGGVLLLLAVVAALRLAVRLWRPASAVHEGGGVRPLEGLRSPRYGALAQLALEEGRLGDAVAAAWHHAAWGIHEQGVGTYEEDLTNRELVAGVRRVSPDWPALPALLSVSARVERWVYGQEVLDPAAVRTLVADASRLAGPSA
jgi:hypothetical protein